MWGAADMLPTKEAFEAALAARHGAALQKKLSAGSVVICGAGGLGSNVALSLARAGVGHLHLLDFDCVEISNLNRQQYLPEQIGLPKAEALRDNLLHVNPYISVTAQVIRLTAENISELLAPYPIICEAFDCADQKAMLVNAVLEHFPDKYLIAASGMAGTASANLIRTRRIAKRFYLCGDGLSDAEAGLPLLSARVAACAAHQATMILRILAEDPEA